MFGSNDDKKTPAEPGEKKGLFGWLRKKPQPAPAEQPAAEQPDSESVEQTGAPVESPVATPQEEQPARVVEADMQPAEDIEPVLLHPEPEAEPEPEPVPAPVVATAPEAPTKLGFFARLRQGLSKTSASIGEGMASLFLGKKAIDDDLLDELETRLLTADVGVEATTAIMQNLTRRVSRKELADSGALYTALQEELVGLLKPVEQPLAIDAGKRPYVILVVGVNGVGKTTTIGKLAKKLQLDGKKVMLAAGDTFRAAAVEQLQVWGERNGIPVIAQHTGADSASVIFDAVQAAKARGIDVLIADTAGRLHTKDNLMEELKKVRRVMGKLDESAPHEVLLVLDAGTGQNAINQTRQFNQAVELTGLALTKLDGTAKGGVIFALAKQFGTPIRYIGVGEGIDDLRTFEADAFVKALFAQREDA
ncbi:signal recognition particle-docking protein FtsY [Stutzerimonas stutzeri]|uniref:signal recognition particle-docking protein FtsY n=1 Tax=Stutzerimonas stutzeri TaxID=316 RepID=UPI000E92FA8E|nr:signal recognition particle-docking protein FtsY [Stutzerimonas stutzeri]MBW8454050.1 signal recognition particle-docking protein FtsY [Pseudomonas sp.]RRV82353.1 signal recognition particle-docking protein FtsY [Stutzerimonas stutzeri]RRW16975.1 signal recognition particle-docking protein FtsY [Stutzerimonas stutzeri]HAW39065.1 signal recognition particle-docking protein FtsY [Pseudomonas sp.]